MEIVSILINVQGQKLKCNFIFVQGPAVTKSEITLMH